MSTSGSRNCRRKLCSTCGLVAVGDSAITCVALNRRCVGFCTVGPACQCHRGSNHSLANRELSCSFCALIVGGLGNGGFHRMSASGSRNCRRKLCSTCGLVAVGDSAITCVALNRRCVGFCTVGPASQCHRGSNDCLADGKLSCSLATLIVVSLSNRGLYSMSTSGGGNSGCKLCSTGGFVGVGHCTVASITRNRRRVGFCTVGPACQCNHRSNRGLANSEFSSGLTCSIFAGSGDGYLHGVFAGISGNRFRIRGAALGGVGERLCATTGIASNDRGIRILAVCPACERNSRVDFDERLEVDGHLHVVVVARHRNRIGSHATGVGIGICCRHRERSIVNTR